MSGIRSFRFWENWYEMAESRDTDEKRLAFYDALFRYAFEGVVPEKPVRGQSPGTEWAAWDAYLVAKNIIDSEAAKRSAGAKGGSAKGSSKARFGNRNASKTQADEQAKRKQNASTDASETQALLSIKDERLKIKDEGVITPSAPPTPPRGEEPPKRRGFNPPTIEEVVAFATNPARHTGGVWDEAWARDWYRQMAELDPPWTDRRGNTIVSWQRRMINDWRIQQERNEKACAPSGGGGSRRNGNSNQPVGVVHQEDDYENPLEVDFMDRKENRQ